MTSQNVSNNMEFLILAMKIKQNWKHEFLWFSVHADNQQAWNFMIFAISNFIVKTPAGVTQVSS